LLDHPSNYVKRLNIDDKAAKSFNILAINFNVLNNYFDGSNKIIFCKKNDFAEGSKILLNTENNFVGPSK